MGKDWGIHGVVGSPHCGGDTFGSLLPMMGHREKMKSGWEWDVFYAKHIVRMKRHVIRYTKRHFNRRVRREAKLSTVKAQEGV